MRYVKRFNESNDDNFDITKALDLEYIKSCFINMIDDYEGDEDWDKSSDGIQKTYEIFFFIDHGNSDIEYILKNFRESIEIIEEIKSCIKKVQIEYPNINPHILIEQEEASKYKDWDKHPGSLDNFLDITCIKVLFDEESIKN